MKLKNYLAPAAIFFICILFSSCSDSGTNPNLVGANPYESVRIINVSAQSGPFAVSVDQDTVAPSLPYKGETYIEQPSEQTWCVLGIKSLNTSFNTQRYLTFVKRPQTFMIFDDNNSNVVVTKYNDIAVVPFPGCFAARLVNFSPAKRKVSLWVGENRFINCETCGEYRNYSDEFMTDEAGTYSLTLKDEETMDVLYSADVNFDPMNFYDIIVSGSSDSTIIFSVYVRNYDPS